MGLSLGGVLCWDEHYLGGALTLLWLGCCIQWLLFACFSVPVATNQEIISKITTAPWNKWFNGIPQRGTQSIQSMREYRRRQNTEELTLHDIYMPFGQEANVSTSNPFLDFFLQYLLPPSIFTESYDDTIYWSPRESSQESFLRYAVLDHFVGAPTPLNPRRTIFRWTLYWLFPVWGGLLVVVSFAAVALLIPDINHAKSTLALITVIWFVNTLYILWKETGILPVWCHMKNDDLKLLPFFVYKYIDDSHTFPSIVNFISKEYGVRIYGIISGVILVAFLTISQIL